jgi:methionine synthase reductase
MDRLVEETAALNVVPTEVTYKFWKFPTKDALLETDLNTLPKIHPSTILVSLATDECNNKGGLTNPSVEASYQYPITGMDIEMSSITAPEAVKTVVSVQFTVNDKRWTCEAGDAFGVICENDPEIVQSFLKLLSLDGDQVICTTPLISIPTESLLSVIADRSLSIYNLFLRYVDLMQFPKKAFLRGLAEYCENSVEKMNLLYLSCRAGSKDYMSLASSHANIMDFLYTFPSCRPPLDFLLSNMTLLHPRFYSVCSATGSNRIEFVYSSIEYPMPDGSTRKGSCSSWLERSQRQLNQGDCLAFSVFPRPSPHFRLSKDSSVPIVMICAGTGISPFIGFLRSETTKRSTAWLFFGFRNQDKDFLFKDELEGFLSDESLSRLTIACSRDSTSSHPKYVQDAIRMHSLEVFKLMTSEPGGLIYICGDELTMIKDVNSCIQEMISEHAQVSATEAQTIFNSWNANKRIIRDVWV